MGDKPSTFSMNRLMKYSELEAFTAQKVAGSKIVYFERLEEFLAAAPPLVNALALPGNPNELFAFLKTLQELQQRLLLIGSPSLLWEAEKVAESARSGDRRKCGDELFTFTARVKSLCGKIEQARFDLAAAKAKTHTPPAAPPPPPAAGADRPPAPIRVESFEKLGLLVDNFELDDAAAMLRELGGFTYSPDIDAALDTILGLLNGFDQEGAADQARRLVDLARAAKPDSVRIFLRKKILAIDDVPDVLNAVKAVLKDSYAVYGVTNHMAALKFLTTNTADLILLDIEMPDMNGFALLGIIRKIKAYEKTPVLFLTGSATLENVKKSRDAGGNDFIRKPIDAEVLLAKIAKHLA